MYGCFRKVEFLLSRGALVWHEWIPLYTLYVVVHCDSGQGSTKLGVRILNVEDPRSQHNIDPLVVYEGYETYENIRCTCGDLLKEIESLHFTELPFIVGGKPLKVVFRSLHVRNNSKVAVKN